MDTQLPLTVVATSDTDFDNPPPDVIVVAPDYTPED